MHQTSNLYNLGYGSTKAAWQIMWLNLCVPNDCVNSNAHTIWANVRTDLTLWYDARTLTHRQEPGKMVIWAQDEITRATRYAGLSKLGLVLPLFSSVPNFQFSYTALLPSVWPQCPVSPLKLYLFVLINVLYVAHTNP